MDSPNSRYNFPQYGYQQNQNFQPNPNQSYDQAMMLAEQLQTSIGLYVSCDFLIGTQILETRDGILAKVGTNFLTIYQPNLERYIVCDLYALKFVTIYNTDEVPNITPSR